MGKKEELADNMYTMFTATMNAPCVVEWCIILCHQYKDLQAKLRGEMMFSGLTSTEKITPENLDKLKYMKCFINESIRYHMPARAPMMRTCTEDVVLPGSGMKVPKDTEVVFCPASITFMEEFWGPDVDKFNPARWEKEFEFTVDISTAHKEHKELGGKKKSVTKTEKIELASREYTFLPFEDGRRACLGRHFAYREVMALLSHFLLSFEIEELDVPKNKDGGWKWENSVICRPDYMKAKLRPINK